MKVKDPLIELLAIALYDQDKHRSGPTSRMFGSWLDQSEEDREIYRRMARGEDDLEDEPS